jgi:putative hydrolase of the HAD superfamily
MDRLVEIIKEESVLLEPHATQEPLKLHSLPGIKSVVFDVYGTMMVSGVGDISHSSDDLRQGAIKDVFSQLEIPLKATIDDPSALLKSIIIEHQDRIRENQVTYPEIDIREVWVEFVNKATNVHSIATEQHPIIEELAVRYELTVNPTWPMTHLQGLLEKLTTNGLVLGIVSNAQFFTPLLFNAYFGKSLDSLGFDDDICQWSYLFKEAKPSTRMYRVNSMKLEAKYGVQPHEVLYVGNDMLNDIVPACRVGFKTCLFAGDKRSLRKRDGDERVDGIEADVVITSLDQILDVI